VGNVAYVSAIFIPTQAHAVGDTLFLLEDMPMFLTRVDLSVYAEGSKRADLTLDSRIMNQSILSSGTTITINFSYICA
jgi:hypothetical protein